MIVRDIPLEKRANLTPQDVRDYYLEMGHRELAVIKERDLLKRELEAARAHIAELEFDNAALVGEDHADRCAQSRRLKLQLATAQRAFDAAERRIADLEGRVRALTQLLMEAAPCSGPPSRS